MDFKAIPRTIGDALDLKRKYIIPRFQREYSWELDELDELWDDLIDSLKVSEGKLCSSEYFIGSLVLIGDDDDTTDINRQIVDGQQRLMTFTIAFSVLCQLFKSVGEHKLSEKTYNYIVGEDADGKPYTKVVAETPKPFFQYRIQQMDLDLQRTPSSPEEKKILFAYKYFEKKLDQSNFIRELNQKFASIEMLYIDALRLFRDQILNCKVIYVTVKSLNDAYTIFEVLNAKGKDLTPVDIIKNSLFSILNQEEPIDLAFEKWTNIKNKVQDGQGDDMLTFYRHFWLSKYSFLTNRRLVKEFKKSIPETQKSYLDFMNALEFESGNYAKIVSPMQSDWVHPHEQIIFQALSALCTFGVTQVRIFLLALFDAKNRDTISQKVFVVVLVFLEYFHFVFNAVCSENPSGMERRYSSYARKLRASTSKEQSRICISELINAQKATLPDLPSFLTNFETIRYTSKQSKRKALVQYILRKIEMNYAPGFESRLDTLTIEHILPESTGVDKVGMLGNLLPMGEVINRELDNKPFSDKIIGYSKSQYMTVKNFLTEYNDKKTWDENDIVKRTRKVGELLYSQNSSI